MKNKDEYEDEDCFIKFSICHHGNLGLDFNFNDSQIENFANLFVMTNYGLMAGQSLEEITKQIATEENGLEKADMLLNMISQKSKYVDNVCSSVEEIQNVIGVEILRIISRYRFIVGIGKAFDSQDVKFNIEKVLCSENKDHKIIWESQHLEIDTVSGHFRQKEEFEEEYVDDMFSEVLDDRIEPENIVSTPFGLWNVNDAMHPLKQFKLWMAHTNFELKSRDESIIKPIDVFRQKEEAQ